MLLMHDGKLCSKYCFRSEKLFDVQAQQKNFLNTDMYEGCSESKFRHAFSQGSIIANRKIQRHNKIPYFGYFWT